MLCCFCALYNRYPCLRVAYVEEEESKEKTYVEEVEERKKKEYYSILVKGVKDSDSHQVYISLVTY